VSGREGWYGTPKERLERRLTRMPNDCLVWTGYTSPEGYGMIGVAHKIVRVHRLAWELYVGPIPEGQLVRHFVCDNPPCCNVAHLRLGTDADNSADKMAKGRQWRGGNGNEKKTHCPHGHEYTPENTYVWAKRRSRQCRRCMALGRARGEK